MEGLNVSNYGRSKRFASITRREPRDRRVWLILEVAALFFSIGRQHPHGGGWRLGRLLGCVTAAGAKAIRHWDRAFRRRSKMGHAQRGLGCWRILVWLLIGNSDVGGLSLACLSVPHVILDARGNMLMHVRSGSKAVTVTHQV